MFNIRTTTKFLRDYKHYYRKDRQLEDEMTIFTKMLSRYPFFVTLKTHKVSTKIWGTAYSSRVTNDLRVIWKFDKDKITIMFLQIGGHSGKNSVYK